MIWTLLLDLDRGLFWVLSVLVVVGLVNWYRREGPAKDCGTGHVEFRPGLLLYASMGTMVALVPAMAFAYVRLGSYWMAAICSLCVIVPIFIAVFDLPGTIVANSEGLEQHYWLRRDRRLAWSDVVDVRASARKREVVLTGADGTRIEHKASLGGRSRFIEELRQHCAAALPADFRREPLESA